MALNRQVFDVNTDTGTWTDSGPSFMGSVLQGRWEATAGDTGGDLLQMWLQLRPGDTGNGIPIASETGLNANFTRCWRQPSHNSLGAQIDTGEPVVAAGEHLRVKVTPDGAAVVGRLYIWTYTG